MKRPRFTTGKSGFTLAEVLIAASAGLMVLAVLASTSLTLQRTMSASGHFARASNDGSRLVDYVVQDLRRAVRVGQLIGGVETPVKNNATFAVSETITLTINIPDYYRSNTPDRAPDSPFRTSRYARQTLNLLPLFNGSGAAVLNGTILYNEAVTKIGSVETTRFAPGNLGTGEVQVRYYRAPRSASDPTACYFRAEYPPGATAPHFAPEEIAERIVTRGDPVTLQVEVPNFPVSDARYGKVFKIKSAFTPQFRRVGAIALPAEQALTVLLRNGRRD